jgi:hypothetical protein
VSHFTDWTDRELLEEVDECGERLNKWEIEFVESVTITLRKHRKLTKAQRRVLEKIAIERLL